MSEEKKYKNWKEAPDWLIKVCQEYLQLGKRISALDNFLFQYINKEVELSAIEYDLLSVQADAMVVYLKMLKIRMNHYGLDPSDFRSDLVVQEND